MPRRHVRRRRPRARPWTDPRRAARGSRDPGRGRTRCVPRGDPSGGRDGSGRRTGVVLSDAGRATASAMRRRPRSGRCPSTPRGDRRPRRTARARPAGARARRAGRRRPSGAGRRSGAAGSARRPSGASSQTDGPGVPQRPAAERVDDRAAARGDDGTRDRDRARHLGRLDLPEPRLAVPLDDARRRAAGPCRDLRVDIHERPRQRDCATSLPTLLLPDCRTDPRARSRQASTPSPTLCRSPARIASMGAGTPSHSSRLRHAWPRSMPAPARAAAPAARASRTRRVGLGR